VPTTSARYMWFFGLPRVSISQAFFRERADGRSNRPAVDDAHIHAGLLQAADAAAVRERHNANVVVSGVKPGHERVDVLLRSALVPVAMTSTTRTGRLRVADAACIQNPRKAHQGCVRGPCQLPSAAEVAAGPCAAQHRSNLGVQPRPISYLYGSLPRKK